MAGLIQNPELVRHLRMELRPKRLLIAFGVVALLCALAWMGFTQDNASSRGTSDPSNYRGLYATLLTIQAILLCLWCLSACSQFIAGERVQKTYDFLRTTRLTSGELLTGMVLGVPSMAYFTIACSLPFSVVAGIAGGFSIRAIFITYAMLVLVTLVISLAGLNISMMTEKPRAGEIFVLVFFFLWPLLALGFAMGKGSPLPGLSAIAVVPGILKLYGSEFTTAEIPTQVPFFAFQVPTLFVSVVIWATAGVWLVVALVRNLKKELDEIRLLSHWQSLGFVAYINVLILALLDLKGAAAGSGTSVEQVASGVSSGYLVFNWLVLYGVGIALLTPAESLKTWWRRPVSGIEKYWSEDGPPWLWMLACAAVVFVLFTGEIAASTASIPVAKWKVGEFAARLAVVLIYCVRDVLFLQWCMLTRMKSPVTKGILFLFLYYMTVSIVISVFVGSARETMMESAFAVVTPSGALMGNVWRTTLIGAVIQVAISIVLLLAIQRRIEPQQQTAKAS